MIGTKEQPVKPQPPWHLAWDDGGCGIPCLCPKRHDHDSWILDPILDARNVPPLVPVVPPDIPKKE